jgi:hypothetical protein
MSGPRLRTADRLADLLDALLARPEIDPAADGRVGGVRIRHRHRSCDGPSHVPSVLHHDPVTMRGTDATAPMAIETMG